MLNETQITALTAPLATADVKTRKGPGGKSMSYVEGYAAIYAANEIFGFDGWARETLVMEPIFPPQLITETSHPERGKVVAAYCSKVRITLIGKDGRTGAWREGWGAATSYGRTAGDAIENAIKAAERTAASGLTGQIAAAMRRHHTLWQGQPASAATEGASA